MGAARPHMTASLSVALTGIGEQTVARLDSQSDWHFSLRLGT